MNYELAGASLQLKAGRSIITSSTTANLVEGIAQPPPARAEPVEKKSADKVCR
jgi:hypothetical protein